MNNNINKVNNIQVLLEKFILIDNNLLKNIPQNKLVDISIDNLFEILWFYRYLYIVVDQKYIIALQFTEHLYEITNKEILIEYLHIFIKEDNNITEINDQLLFNNIMICICNSSKIKYIVTQTDDFYVNVSDLKLNSTIIDNTYKLNSLLNKLNIDNLFGNLCDIISNITNDMDEKSKILLEIYKKRYNVTSQFEILKGNDEFTNHDNFHSYQFFQLWENLTLQFCNYIFEFRILVIPFREYIRYKMRYPKIFDTIDQAHLSSPLNNIFNDLLNKKYKNSLYFKPLIDYHDKTIYDINNGYIYANELIFINNEMYITNKLVLIFNLINKKIISLNKDVYENTITNYCDKSYKELLQLYLNKQPTLAYLQENDDILFEKLETYDISKLKEILKQNLKHNEYTKLLTKKNTNKFIIDENMKHFYTILFNI